MASKVDIWNMALTFLDVSQSVKSENDNSAAAGTCKRYYDVARRKVLEDGQWDFAVKMPALSLVLDQNTLQATQVIYPGWRFVYARPNDCVRFLSVTTQFGLRTNPFLAYWWRAGAMDCSAGSWGPFRPPYRQALDQVNTQNPNASVNILTDQDSAYGVYVADVTNVALFSQKFQEAIAWNMCPYIAGPVSANQAAKANALKMAPISISSAIAKELAEQQPDPYPDSPAITARN